MLLKPNNFSNLSNQNFMQSPYLVNYRMIHTRLYCSYRQCKASNRLQTLVHITDGILSTFSRSVGRTSSVRRVEAKTPASEGCRRTLWQLRSNSSESSPQSSFHARSQRWQPYHLYYRTYDEKMTPWKSSLNLWTATPGNQSVLSQSDVRRNSILWLSDGYLRILDLNFFILYLGTTKLCLSCFFSSFAC